MAFFTVLRGPPEWRDLIPMLLAEWVPIVVSGSRPAGKSVRPVGSLRRATGGIWASGAGHSRSAASPFPVFVSKHMKIPSWRQNLRRRGGFWKDGRWYDLHIERRMPLVMPMLEEMVVALPPLGAGTTVCDLACGTGNASFVVLTAYPLVRLTLLDQDPDLLEIAMGKISEFTEDARALEAVIRADGETIPGGPYEVVLASLAVHTIVGQEVDGAEAETRYELLFRGIRDALAPGGHLIVADHVGTLGLYRQMKAMERAGFSDVDCAWRQDEFFVCGGRIGE